ncbi:hypothetical protein DL96DRAFT_1623232 [Flagelloscypha sp. PMI_526]|nr:hypothetical protein DL96DRAFT_1623232 [Flagelloscypha sp. PMI_526]
MSTMTGHIPPVDLPPELLIYILSYIDDHPTLKACSLAARVFIQPAQSRLFYRLDLTADSMADLTLEKIQSTFSSSHLTKYIRSLVTTYGHEGLPTLLDALPGPQDVSQGMTLNSLALSYDGIQPLWTIPVLRPLHEKVLPFLVSLTLDTLDGPFAIVASCRVLQSLRSFTTVLYLEEQEEFRDLFPAEEDNDPLHPFIPPPSIVKSTSMEFVTTLAIDGTQNPNGSLCPLIILIQSGGFPALKSLDMSRIDTRWFPQEHVSIVLKPLMNQLMSIDIGLWSEWDALLDEKEYLDLFRVHNYPHLHSYSFDLGYGQAPVENDVSVNRSLMWLVESLETLVSDHPLEVLTLRLGTDWNDDNIEYAVDVSQETGGDFSGLEEIWKRLDCTLTENLCLKKFEKIVIPVRAEFIDMRRLLEQSLRRLSVAGKISFELFNPGG